MTTTTQTSAQTAQEAVAILATFIGQKDAEFFTKYFENGFQMTVYTHQGYICVVDHTGMCVWSNNDQVFASFRDELDYAKMNNAKNPFEACKANAETIMEISVSDEPEAEIPTRHYIVDKTSNSAEIAYVMDESAAIIHDPENCISFDTEKDAQQLIDSKGWDWAGVFSM